MGSFRSIRTGEEKFSYSELADSTEFEPGFNHIMSAGYDGSEFLVKYCPKGGIDSSVYALSALYQLEDVELPEAYVDRKGNKIAVERYTDAVDFEGLEWEDEIYQSIDRSSLIGSVASKLLVADWDLKLGNLLLDREGGDGRIIPIDFEHAMRYGHRNVFVEKLALLKEQTGLDIGYDDVLKRAENFSEEVEPTKIYSTVKSILYTSDEVFERFVTHVKNLEGW